MTGMCGHLWKFLKSSKIVIDNKNYHIDRYECRLCERVYTIDKVTGQRLNLQGMVGEEA